MGTEVLVVLPPGEGTAVLTWLREVERVFSRFLSGSDVSRANAGGRVAVSALFLRVLDEACAYQAWTDGLFSPFLGAELARLGYSVDFDLIGEPSVNGPAVAASDSFGRASSGDLAELTVHLDHDRRTVRLPPGLAIDLGGFVKGWSVQAAADAAVSPRGLIDAGGDLVAWRGAADPPWRVGIEHPSARAEGQEPATVGVLELPRCAAVATSSTVRRSWRSVTGERLHHIVDPRTGDPADSDCRQATVVATSLPAAEVYATCMTILGTVDGPAWLADRDPTAAWIIVGDEGEVRHSTNLPLERPA